MSLIVKIMSDEDLADDDTRKSFELFTDVKSVEFHRRPGAPVAALAFSTGSVLDGEYPMTGNAYVMNESGKTIASFGCAPPVTHDQADFNRLNEVDVPVFKKYDGYEKLNVRG